MKTEFFGNDETVMQSICAEGLEYCLSLGRRAPMHRMHVDCILEIIRAGLKPVIVIGSTNGPESNLYDPVRNPLTVEQQRQQLYHALGDLEYNEALVMTLDDAGDDKSWMEDFVGKVKMLGLYGKTIVHFRSKAADQSHMKEAIPPLSQYTASFVQNGLAVWQSYNTDSADDLISATDIRRYDLENLTPEQRAVISAPDFLIDLARRARAENPDRALLEAHQVPLTVLDLSFSRLWREAGIRTRDIILAAHVTGEVNAAILAQMAAEFVKKTRPAALQPSNQNTALSGEKNGPKTSFAAGR